MSPVYEPLDVIVPLSQRHGYLLMASDLRQIGVGV